MCCGESNSMPILGEPAPDFEVLTTGGMVKLSDFKGKWLVLFSHPADFTPVCTTEFMAFISPLSAPPSSWHSRRLRTN